MSEALPGILSILVVEDDAGDFGLIKAFVRHAVPGLGGEFAPVVWAKTLADGIDAARHGKPDVVLLDLSLPDSSGLATVQAMRSVLPDTPIIVLTGFDDNALAIAALEAGAQDYLVKGRFEHDALERAVRHAQVRQKLESRLRLFEVALNSAANGIVITDPESGIEWANRAFTRLSGFSLEEVLAHKPSECIKSGTHDQAFYRRMWETILAGQVWQGEITNRRKDGTLYDEELTIAPVTDVNGTIRHFVAIKQDITERKVAAAQVSHLAHYDVLTDLPNRALLTDRLQQALAQVRRDKGKLAVMFLDLDKFKPVNDTLGHNIGDQLLKQVAMRLTACLQRESDTVSRIGGDEFVILLASIEGVQDCVAMAEKVLDTINQPFSIGPHVIDISASVGIAVYPQHGDDAHSLQRHADTAMYEAKRGGRHCYRIFIDEMEGADAAEKSALMVRR
jgi:diguanylate cyclase (GGDEF)-like protein/PAS domain S-box-containing protein